MNIKYPFSEKGVQMFLDDTLQDIYNALENGTDEEEDFFITIGNREIRIPLHSEGYEDLSELLHNTIKYLIKGEDKQC